MKQILGFAIAVIPYLDSYYPFDSNSRNVQDAMVSHGKSVLLKFSYFQGMEKFAEVVYLHEGN